MAIADSPEAESNITNAASIVTLGLDGSTWDKLMLWALAVAALAAGAVVVTTGGSILTHKREAEAAEHSLERYKETVAGKVAEAHKAGVEAGRAAGGAAVKAAEANERAAKLEAANLALETQIQPRRFTSVNGQQVGALRPFAGQTV
ncbi:hypothetical protein [Methylobacterium sp. ap11]|uniref:hypothetical protein n=1 Tax=Methylobacterium sp. ap11 TaxID=1761799 RepID=UPI0011601B30|nr:hypothetical protein [Methylobacterium sp. ap11]